MLSTIEKMNADEEGNKQILELEEDSSASIGESLETEENADIFLDNFVEEALKLATIYHMRCAIHTLQLAIRDGLKDRHAATLIGKLQQEFYKALEEVEKYDRSSKLTVEEAILVYPEIVSDVARIVTAMPPTQLGTAIMRYDELTSEWIRLLPGKMLSGQRDMDFCLTSTQKGTIL
ncbi:UNVERIFIED_CONTAM: hypothetical protein K2H54_041872 [Gekko kuhli]